MNEQCPMCGGTKLVLGRECHCVTQQLHDQPKPPIKNTLSLPDIKLILILATAGLIWGLAMSLILGNLAINRQESKLQHDHYMIQINLLDRASDLCARGPNTITTQQGIVKIYCR